MKGHLTLWSHRGLVALAFRRVFSTTFVVGFTVIAMLWQFENSELVNTTDFANETVIRGLRRESAWSFMALLVLPACLFAAARAGERWRLRDRDWIGSRAVSKLAFAASTYLGISLGGALLAATIGLVVELSAGGDGTALRRVQSLPVPVMNLIESGEQARFRIDESEEVNLAGRSIRLELRATPGAGPTAKVRLACRRSSADSQTEIEAIVSGRTSIGFELPSGVGGLDFTLTKVGAGCGVVALSGSLVLFESVASERVGSWTILVRVLLWMCAWIALALGLGSWMSAITATVLCLALQLPAWNSVNAFDVAQATALSSYIPGADLVQSLKLLGDGLVPAHALPHSLLGLAIFVVVGLALAVAGQKRGPAR
ncbi:MAG: hypothetical protein ACI8TQ_001170 [Planctomycetota bacterium]